MNAKRKRKDCKLHTVGSQATPLLLPVALLLLILLLILELLLTALELLETVELLL